MDSLVQSRVAILQALTSGDGYGLDLMRRVEESSGGKVKLRQGSVYPALRDLECEGYLTSYEVKPAPKRGGRSRYYYKLTAKGRKAATRNRKAIAGVFGLG